MPEKATTPDVVDLTRLAFEAANRRDLDAVISFFASDTVFEGRDGARLSTQNIGVARAAAEALAESRGYGRKSRGAAGQLIDSCRRSDAPRALRNAAATSRVSTSAPSG